MEGRAGAFELVLSPLLVAELSEVLGRDKFRRYVTTAEAEAFVAVVTTGATVRPDPGIANPPHPSDPDDQYLVDLVVAARANALVTRDKALLELRDVIPVMTPAEFMASLAGL